MTKFPSKDTANPFSHQVIASSNLFSSTQAVAPVGNNTNGHIITAAQFQQKNQKPDWKLNPYRPGKTKKKQKTK